MHLYADAQTPSCVAPHTRVRGEITIWASSNSKMCGLRQAEHRADARRRARADQRRRARAVQRQWAAGAGRLQRNLSIAAHLRGDDPCHRRPVGPPRGRGRPDRTKAPPDRRRQPRLSRAHRRRRRDLRRLAAAAADSMPTASCRRSSKAPQRSSKASTSCEGCHRSRSSSVRSPVGRVPAAAPRINQVRPSGPVMAASRRTHRRTRRTRHSTPHQCPALTRAQARRPRLASCRLRRATARWICCCRRCASARFRRCRIRIRRRPCHPRRWPHQPIRWPCFV